MNFRNFLSFERMITPVIITILFWIGLIVVALSAIYVFFSGIYNGINGDGFGAVLGGLFGGPLVFVLGGLMVRIYAELLILAFRINETLTDIKNELKKE